ncbi:uncharacterized protein N7500_001988 [Penicillium coprophilum]|uniref:uncharacterized protein n=1 Tax=Penicillium coprophilum TaxID=36646 RepID=UPI0023A107F5|nr:uncharacterized protein N7500_001988 [Penicillium coprophilum]KAJ5174057.1 hypothetical protein N7500_001988 [Penicillium coprophilum]
MTMRYEVLIPDKYLDYPIYKLIDSSELGTKANPIDCLRLDNKAVNDRATKVTDHPITLYDRNKYKDTNQPISGTPDNFSITDQF